MYGINLLCSLFHDTGAGNETVSVITDRSRHVPHLFGVAPILYMHMKRAEFLNAIGQNRQFPNGDIEVNFRQRNGTIRYAQS